MQQGDPSNDVQFKLHARLGFRLTRLAKLNQSRIETRLAAMGMTRLKWCVLSSVGFEDIVFPSDLADHIGITRPATSRLLNEMRKDGLIVQSLDQTDGRSRRISVTVQGIAKLNLCLPVVNEGESYFAGKLDSATLERFSDTLDLMLDGETTKLDSL